MRYGYDKERENEHLREYAWHIGTMHQRLRDFMQQRAPLTLAAFDAMVEAEIRNADGASNEGATQDPWVAYGGFRSDDSDRIKRGSSA